MNDRFVAAVEAIYDAAPEPSRWPDALQAIADAFGDVGAVMVYSRDDGRFAAICTRSLQSMVVEYERHFKGQDLRAIRGVQRGIFLERDAVTDHHVVSQEEIENHPYYRMMARHGLKYFAGVPISPDPRVNIAISVQRAITREPYGDIELELLTRLGHHAERSLRLSIRLLDAELANVGLGEALARLEIGVFALDSLRRVVFRNPAAERLLGNGVAIIRDQLLFNAPLDRAALDALIDNAIGGTAKDVVKEPKPVLVSRTHLERPLAVYVLPVGHKGPVAEQFLTHTRAIVLVIDPKPGDPPDPALVRDVLGLTLGEARIAALIGTGMAPRDAATQLGITEETARTTLKRVFSKTSVSRQSELTALLTKLVLR